MPDIPGSNPCLSRTESGWGASGRWFESSHPDTVTTAPVNTGAVRVSCQRDHLHRSTSALPSRFGQVKELGLFIEADFQNSVDHISPLAKLCLDGCDGSADHPELLGARQFTVEHEDDAWVKLSGPGQPLEVLDVGRHQDAVFLEGALENHRVWLTQQSTISDVGGVEIVLGAQLSGNHGGEVFVNEQLHVERLGRPTFG